MIDLYLIACALYFDFESNNLINGENEIGQQAKDYFSPYKKHKFIKQMGKYVEETYKDFNFNVLIPLNNYCLWNKQEKIPISQLLSKVFQTEQDFLQFFNELQQFYKDTKAQQFFASQQKYNQRIKEDIKKGFAEKDFKAYIEAMENYVNNKEIHYPKQNVKYGVFMSLYRPSGASFYPVYDKNTVEFICFTAALEDRKDVNSFNMDRIIENAMHEYLHMYINPSVQKNQQVIEDLTQNKMKMDYVGPMYQGFPWNRVVDENIVRAVQARIYSQIFRDEQKAYEQILRKEVEWGGFKKVDKLHRALNEYEENREKYTTIDVYVPELIKVLLKE